MTVADYKPFVDRMIQRYEGGYGWDPNDPGGPTRYGITCYDLAEYDHEPMNSMAAWAPIVEEMSLDTAEVIYEEKYATAVDFDHLNTGCDCVVFDFDVNSGSTAIRYAQQVVGVPIDGLMGPITLAAINSTDPATFVNNLCDARLGFLRSLTTWSVFGTGWSNRVADLRAYSLGLIQPEAKKSLYQPKLQLIDNAFAKAYPQGALLGEGHD
jgi:lysozyme family protein